MKIDALFVSSLVYDVQYRIDIVKDSICTLFPDSMDGIEVYSNNDEVLSLTIVGNEIAVKADNLGESKIRFMQESTIVRELLFVSMESLGPPAASLGIEAEEPTPK